MTNPIADPTLAHQIVLTASSRSVPCLNGERTRPASLAVTCNCHRIGTSDGYTTYIAPLPVGDEAVAAAWRAWNTPSMHDGSDFEPNEQMLARHGSLDRMSERF